jgi:hypothetical protein
MSLFARCWICDKGSSLFEPAPRVKLTDRVHICVRCFHVLMNTSAVDKVFMKEASALKSRFTQELF